MRILDQRAWRLAVLGLTFCVSGCCTQYVHNIGKTEARLSPKRILSNETGDLVVETELRRYSLNDRDSSYSLGPRYVYLYGPDAKQEIGDVLRKRHNFQRRGTNYVQIGRTNFNPEFPSRWHFAPPDVLHRVDSLSLPEGIGQPLREFAPRRWSGRNWTDSELQYNVGGTNYVVEVNVAANDMWFPDAYHQAGWGYPLKILYVPALALDVATFPIQFIWFAHEMGKWGDGSGVR